VLKGAEAESVPDEPQSIKEGVSTDIPVMTTTKFDDGSIGTEWGGFDFVPSPARLANPETKDDIEKIALGARLICRIRRIDEAATLLLLDVIPRCITLSRTKKQVPQSFFSPLPVSNPR